MGSFLLGLRRLALSVVSTQYAGDLTEGGWGEPAQVGVPACIGPGFSNGGRKRLKQQSGADEGNKPLSQLVEFPDQSSGGELGKGADNKAQFMKRMKWGCFERHSLRSQRSHSV
ncbi:hypothetical protein NDU88_001896 [Pleurodeles waltl]|uniref:Prepronociceptin n=1 Tax=Pleurodeles waltl TaxID=8319 RepID=A0AAV7SC61_PLEWA|nr:hypothetical protein NDU88_001896 [Pleurodeles waltl]